MSAITHGMDIEAVRQLAAQMNQRADEIRQLMATLSNSLTGTAWSGPDREQFVSDWQGQYVQQLTNVAQALNDAAQRATVNAQAQEQASSGA